MSSLLTFEYSLHVGNKNRYRCYMGNMTSATIAEIRPSNFNDESRAKVITDVAFREGLDDILDPTFSTEESGYDNAPLVGKCMKVNKVSLVNGTLISGKNTITIEEQQHQNLQHWGQ